MLDELVGGRADLADFFSPSALHGLIDMLWKQPPERLPRQTCSARIACVGPTTAAALRAQGLEVEIQPEDYTVDGLVAAFVEMDAQRRTP